MIRLTRAVPVACFEAQATVAVGRTSPELLAVARLAADLDRPIGARDVLRELLGDLPEVLGQRVLELCVRSLLLEPVGNHGEAALSEAGRMALAQGVVLKPAEGLWRFFVIDDPLVPSALIHVAPIEGEAAYKERAAAKENPRVLREPMPGLLRACEKALPRQSLQDGHLFQLVKLAPHGRIGAGGELKLTLTWEAGPSLRISGALPSGDDAEGAKAIDVDLPLPEALARWNHERMWRALVTHATRTPELELERWHLIAGKPVVPVSFASTSAASKRGFRQDLDVPAVRWSDIGDFKSTQLSGVDLVPATERDAQAWLTWLQWEEISDYVTPERLRDQARALVARFPHHSPLPLRAGELLAKALAERGERAWFLLGPADLGLWS